MKDVEVKFNSFKLKKLVALSMCAVMAMGVMMIPVGAAAQDAEIRPTGTGATYTGDATGDAPTWVATGDAKNPTKVIDAIKNAPGTVVNITVNKEVQTMPKAVFDAAKDSGKKLTFTNFDADGSAIFFDFKEGTTNSVDMNFGIKTSIDSDLVKDLKDNGAMVIEFAHEGVLPGPMEVSYFNETYLSQRDSKAYLYLLNEKTGKLEKQEQSVIINDGVVTFTINHCSSYVVALTEIEEAKLQVAEAKPDPTPAEKEPEAKDTGTKESVLKAAGSETAAFQTIALITLCGAAIVIATKKEKRA